MRIEYGQLVQLTGKGWGMRRIATATLVLIAVVCGALGPAYGQIRPNAIITTRNPMITPLGGYVMGGLVCAAIAPMIGTVVLGREMTNSEVGQTTLSCFLGPIGGRWRWYCFPARCDPGHQRQ